jgi:hypothetical protein
MYTEQNKILLTKFNVDLQHRISLKSFEWLGRGNAHARGRRWPSLEVSISFEV